MFRPVTRTVLAFTLAVFPTLAHAGTSVTNGTANFNVTEQCSVSGKVVNLGAYPNFTTMRDLGLTLGYFENAASTPDPGYYQMGYLTPGSKGDSWANWGAVTCTNGTLYNLKIVGTALASALVV